MLFHKQYKSLIGAGKNACQPSEQQIAVLGQVAILHKEKFPSRGPKKGRLAVRAKNAFLRREACFFVAQRRNASSEPPGISWEPRERLASRQNRKLWFEGGKIHILHKEKVPPQSPENGRLAATAKKCNSTQRKQPFYTETKSSLETLALCDFG